MSTLTRSVLLLLVLVSMFLMAWKFFNASNSGEHTQAFSAAEAQWIKRIHTIGGSAAYRELSDSIAIENPSVQHQQGHVFGGALYEAEGGSGLSVCDAQYNYSCFHEFLGRAISSEGLSSLQAFDDACFAANAPRPLSCQHGIGHGILAYIGYEKKNVDDALDECRRLSHIEPIGGCYGGVFMEFNFRTMLSEESIRLPLQGNLRFPCDDVRSEYLDACAFWLPGWWLLVYEQAGDSKETAFSKMGLLCDTFESSAQRHCYEGIGNITARESKYDARAGARLCDVTSSRAENRLLCRTFLADSLSTGGAGKTGDAAAACEDLPDTMQRTCMKYVTE